MTSKVCFGHYKSNKIRSYLMLVSLKQLSSDTVDQVSSMLTSDNNDGILQCSMGHVANTKQKKLSCNLIVNVSLFYNIKL